MKPLLTLLVISVLFSEIKTQKSVQNDLGLLTRDYLPEQFTNTNFTLEDAKTLLHKKCRKVALISQNPPQTYENIEMAANKLIQCANSIANITVLMAEIEAARPAGDLDVVFHKYCRKLPQAENCLLEFNAQILPCLTPAERAQNAIMMRIITSLLGFICHKDGDQIALFIAEEGPECLDANKENISNCMNATFSAYLPEGGVLKSQDEWPELVLGPKQCIDLHDFEECVLSYLEKCNEITPANIIESLFRHVKNETKCQEEIDKVISFQPSQMQQRNMGVSYTLYVTFYLATFMFALSVTWYNAFLICRTLGGFLASYDSAQELADISNYLISKYPLNYYWWLSGSDQDVEGKFFWYNTGEAIKYADWSDGQPDNMGGNEDCVHLWHLTKKYQMNDARCNMSMNYICQADKPITIAVSIF
ncbi:27 kDa hemolymph protein-like [Lucilia cuprina]|uniref:27 kDa hemolymph protein-like n=1 Tax=Lucilia cuprina TaxID=7375 RepID=UPI001F0633F6|nr:27 kDa hemolymph protein-like [Lucilia cuprina]